MTAIAHMIDHLEFGGVNRNLDTLLAHMPDVTQIRHVVSPRTSLPPVVPAGQLVAIHWSVSWSRMPHLAALRAMRGKAPIVIVEHSFTESYEKYAASQMKFRAMLRMAYSFADRVVAVSHGQGAWLRGAGIVDPKKVYVIPSSTDCAPLETIPFPTRRGPCAEPLKIGAYGRYTEQKGFGNLIRAMRELPPGLASLTLAGVGPYEAQLKAMAGDLPNVTVGGPTLDVRGFLAGFDLVAVPSRWESFGQVALEARSAGRPLICSAVDGLVEQTGDAWGWLVPEDDIPALSRAIRAANVADLATMGQAARWSAEGHLDMSLDAWRHLAAGLLKAPAAMNSKAA